MVNKKLLSPFHNTLLFNTLIKLSGFAKLSFIVGSQVAFFSGVAIMAPLAGAFAGVSGSFGVFGTGILIRAFLSGWMPYHFLAYHIPGLFASLFWAIESRIIRIMPAVLCMLIFIMHPVGSSAAFYSLFWLIPIYTTLFCKDTIVTRAAGSTFTAHAVGSVIWLFAIPMTADQWLALIPVVIVERALFAVGMVIGYKVIEFAISKFNVSSLRYPAVALRSLGGLGSERTLPFALRSIKDASRRVAGRQCEREKKSV
jgi:hypothetical protein